MGKRKKKQRNLGPRRKRMRRPARLQAAPKWRATYGGTSIVGAYRRWIGVDLLCAIAELRMLAVEISAEYEQQVRQTIAARTEFGARRRAAKLAADASLTAFDGPEQWLPNDDAEGQDDIPY